ncbi:hypothetical protein BDK51DRAFT_28153 [Blyttiomyces helicus]|uniref:NADH:flavin oxidoreductase/NADH oxidase N-terminal domain-containing protein n=1 Tax=Blyttiomyces helicus TaxID=388810 RepID=A0A4P9W259_9FUNG|nr:hypothetical protein BDK51DRAFT_28153 [Blyttiomyces helicus]|eukprot:RKO86299.1 hypothetical protein BDK51DRAFT_28153 [Blyttiomyces helicus]
MFGCRDNEIDDRLENHLRVLHFSIMDSFATSGVFVFANVEWNAFLPDEINVMSTEDELDLWISSPGGEGVGLTDEKSTFPKIPNTLRYRKQGRRDRESHRHPRSQLVYSLPPSSPLEQKHDGQPPRHHHPHSRAVDNRTTKLSMRLSIASHLTSGPMKQGRSSRGRFGSRSTGLATVPHLVSPPRNHRLYKLIAKSVRLPVNDPSPWTAPRPTPSCKWLSGRGSGKLPITPALISEGLMIEPLGSEWTNAAGIFSEKQIAGWKKVTDAVHAEGSFIFAQLWHAGRMTHPALQAGQQNIRPSAIEGRQVPPACGYQVLNVLASVRRPTGKAGQTFDADPRPLGAYLGYFIFSPPHFPPGDGQTVGIDVKKNVGDAQAAFDI